MESLCRVLALKETGSPRQGPHLAEVLLSQTLLLPGQGLGVTAAGQLDTQKHNPLILAGNMGWNSEYENSP